MNELIANTQKCTSFPSSVALVFTPPPLVSVPFYPPPSSEISSGDPFAVSLHGMSKVQRITKLLTTNLCELHELYDLLEL